MKLEDLKYIKETLEYALNDCPVKDGDHETHFNTFANAISLVDAELNLLNIPVVSINEVECCDSETHNRYTCTDGFAYCPDCGEELW